MSEAYPKREAFFSHRYVRLMIKSVAASVIGPEGFALCTVIAATEDAKRYKGKVTYHNEHLMSLCGCKSWNKFSRIRRIAVDEGWLNYDPPRRGSLDPGKYWVSIPAGAGDIPDGPTDENPAEYQSPDDRQNDASNQNDPQIRRSCPDDGIREGVSSGDRSTNDSSNQHIIGGSSGDHRGIIGVSSGEHTTLTLSLALTLKTGSGILKKVNKETLGDTGALISLCGELAAIAPDEFPDSQSNRLRIVSAAERALEVGENPAALFVDLVSQERWDFITEKQEDRANARLRAEWEFGPRKDPVIQETLRSLAASKASKYV